MKGGIYRTFHFAHIRHLPHSHSDHCLLLLRLQADDGVRLGNRPFGLLSTWMTHSNFFTWLECEWQWDGDLMSSLKHFAEKLQA